MREVEATAKDGGAEKLLAAVAARLDDKPVEKPVAEHEAIADSVPKDDAAWEEDGDPSTEGSAAALHQWPERTTSPASAPSNSG